MPKEFFHIKLRNIEKEVNLFVLNFSGKGQRAKSREQSDE